MSKTEMPLLAFKRYCEENKIKELVLDTTDDALKGDGTSILKMRFDKVFVQVKPDIVYLANSVDSLEINSVKKVIMDDIVQKECSVTFICHNIMNENEDIRYTFLAKF